MIPKCKRIRLSDAAALLSKSFGKRIKIGTVRRWIVKGLLSPAGHRVKLKSGRFDGFRHTTVQWCEQFISAFNSDSKQ